MSELIRQAEIAAEQRYLDRVYTRLETLRHEVQRRHKEGFRLASTRTPGSLVERDAMVHHAALRLRELESQYEGLVFGRLDLTTGETRYVGRIGLRDEDYEPLVIDWRAPGAAAFYQATAEDPMAVIRRRVIRCTGSTVLDIEDDLLDMDAAAARDSSMPEVTVVGDGALLASLAQAKGERMRDIVATIQREQDQAIRAPAAGVAMIEGGPGTGKTAVALHRAAHLLYRDRRRFEGGGVLLIGPSPVFMSYVERVLPSLGEETAELRSLGEVVDEVRSDRFDTPDLAQLKGSSRMRRLLLQAVRLGPPHLGPPHTVEELRVVYGGEVLRVRSEQLTRVRRDLNTRIHQPNAAGAEARRALIGALWQVRPPEARWDATAFADEVADRDEFIDFAHAWWPVTSPVTALSWLGDVARVRAVSGGWLTDAQCVALAQSWRRVPEDLSVADVALVDELRVILGEPPRRRRPGPGRDMGIDTAGGQLRELSTVSDRYYATPERQARCANYDGYAHVLVDEAQDLSPMQWRMIGRRGRQASWTIVGDAAQSAWPDLDEARHARADALRGKTVHRFHLGTNYRNSAEIYEFAASLVRRAVPDADLPIAVRRTGVEPEHLLMTEDSVGAVRDVVTRLLGEVDGTVGVIAAAARVPELTGIGLTRPRVRVMDGMRAKGMEYDAVVVVEPGEIIAESVAGIRVLYVALTRATHRLVTLASDDGWRTVS